MIHKFCFFLGWGRITWTSKPSLTLLFTSSAFVFGRNMHNSIGINIKSNFNLWDSTWGRRDANLLREQELCRYTNHTNVRKLPPKVFHSILIMIFIVFIHMTYQCELSKKLIIHCHFTLTLANFNFDLCLPISSSRKHLSKLERPNVTWYQYSSFLSILTPVLLGYTKKPRQLFSQM